MKDRSDIPCIGDHKITRIDERLPRRNWRPDCPARAHSPDGHLRVIVRFLGVEYGRDGA